MPAADAPPFVPFLWDGSTPTGKLAAFALVGVMAVGIGARIDLPMTPVPMSLQTLAVVLAGALGGLRLGVTTLLLYLVAAAFGLPVLAGGRAGVAALGGPTAGYLAGFVATAGLVGFLAERGWTARGFLTSSLVMLCGHALTLALGTLWLARSLGGATAAEKGLWPFLPGAVVKSLLAAGIVWLAAETGSPDKRRLDRHEWKNH